MALDLSDQHYLKIKELLKGVSRTFYLNIVFLRKPFNYYIAVCYLLCRIADTLEDDPVLDIPTKKKFLSEFKNLLWTTDKRDFSAWLEILKNLSGTQAEMKVMAETEFIFDFFDHFPSDVKSVMRKRIDILATGMMKYAMDRSSKLSIKNFSELDDYCYYVAGVVGELITGVFICELDYLSDNSKLRLNKYTVSFGLTLQYINLIKDVLKDHKRGWDYFPESLFAELNISRDDFFSDSNIQKQHIDKVFKLMVERTFIHMKTSIIYILDFPWREFKIRSFLFWPILFAQLSLIKVLKNKEGLMNGKPVKISKYQVKLAILLSSITLLSGNLFARFLFNYNMNRIKKLISL